MSGNRRRRRTATASIGLPEDLEIDILRWLPVKSLMRFKSVCKVWYNLIRSVSFITLYNKNGDNRRKVSLFCKSDRFNYNDQTVTISFCLSNTSEELTVPVPVKILNMVGCSYGLVCFPVRQSLSLFSTLDKYLVWNPATRLFRLITAGSLVCYPKSHDLRSGFLFDPNTNTFKLARICFIPSKENPYLYLGVQVDIFTSSEDSWTTKKLDFPCQFYERGNVSWLTCSQRYMYWEVCSFYPAGNCFKYNILCFDMIDELFVRIELPPRGPYDQYGLLSLIRYGESLAMLETPTMQWWCTNVWLINDRDGMNLNSLSREPTFRISPAIRAVGSFRKHEVDWVVLNNDIKYSLYNLKTGETMEFSKYNYWGQQFFLYQESLASVY